MHPKFRPHFNLDEKQIVKRSDRILWFSPRWRNPACKPSPRSSGSPNSLPFPSWKTSSSWLAWYTTRRHSREAACLGAAALAGCACTKPRDGSASSSAAGWVESSVGELEERCEVVGSGWWTPTTWWWERFVTVKAGHSVLTEPIASVLGFFQNSVLWKSEPNRETFRSGSGSNPGTKERQQVSAGDGRSSSRCCPLLHCHRLAAWTL
jgi:hypothetical protein